VDPRTEVMARRFWQQAQRDMETSRVLLAPRTYYAATQQAHQAAEKGLKSLHWHLVGKEAPWIHDLVRLADLLTAYAGTIPEEIRVALEQLQPLFGESRYPDADELEPIPAEAIGEEDARASVASAEKVMAWLDVQLRQPPRT
jgi:HEPN domain-containing protein